MSTEQTQETKKTLLVSISLGGYDSSSYLSSNRKEQNKKKDKNKITFPFQFCFPFSPFLLSFYCARGLFFSFPPFFFLLFFPAHRIFFSSSFFASHTVECDQNGRTLLAGLKDGPLSPARRTRGSAWPPQVPRYTVHCVQGKKS